MYLRNRPGKDTNNKNGGGHVHTLGPEGGGGGRGIFKILKYVAPREEPCIAQPGSLSGAAR